MGNHFVSMTHATLWSSKQTGDCTAPPEPIRSLNRAGRRLDDVTIINPTCTHQPNQQNNNGRLLGIRFDHAWVRLDVIFASTPSSHPINVMRVNDAGKAQRLFKLWALRLLCRCYECYHKKFRYITLRQLTFITHLD